MAVGEAIMSKGMI